MLASLPHPQISKPNPLPDQPLRSSPMTSRHTFASSTKSSGFDDILPQLQNLSMLPPSTPSPIFSRQQSSAPMSYDDVSPRCSPTGFLLGTPLSMFDSYPFKATDNDLPVVIDTFAPRVDLSPTSSTSSDFDSAASQYADMDRSTLEAFVATRSRVVRFYNLPDSAETFLSVIFSSHTTSIRPRPITMWVVREDYSGAKPDCVWAVFKCHQDACAALSLSGTAFSVAAAVENDLKPFHKLRRLDLRIPAPLASPSPTSAALHIPNMLHVSTSQPDLSATRSMLDAVNTGSYTDFTISSNPPNPRTSFRLGDWICSSPKCAAHNFGRNLACIGCGCPRPGNAATSSPQYQASASPTRLLSFPRFLSSNPDSFSPVSPSIPLQAYSSPPRRPTFSPQVSHPVPPHAQKPAHPLLTPSGRAFARGGKVQNISSDPLSPCIMYWPDNEPFPEQGQIRPSGLANIQQPPILNTGNRGPISHQPGDWICQKCNYLNWRRRKVCQTCLPYAEGNGDSISAAVQAERIALLTSVLSQSQQTSPAISQHSRTLTPPQNRRNFVDVSRGAVHRSRSHLDLGTQYTNDSPIYQTSGVRQSSSPLLPGPGLQLHAPAPLLPSFLQNIIQSPNLSPSSTSSADLSFEEYDDSLPSSTRSTFAGMQNSNDLSSQLPLGNIWRLDGEESKSLSVFALPNREVLMGGSRRSSQELGIQATN